jgi:hypothetical protein
MSSVSQAANTTITTGEGWIYVFPVNVNENIYKVGMTSSNPTKRQRNYNTLMPTTEFILCEHVSSHATTRERIILKMFDDFRQLHHQKKSEVLQSVDLLQLKHVLEWVVSLDEQHVLLMSNKSSCECWVDLHKKLLDDNSVLSQRATDSETSRMKCEKELLLLQTSHTFHQRRVHLLEHEMSKQTQLIHQYGQLITQLVELKDKTTEQTEQSGSSGNKNGDKNNKEEEMCDKPNTNTASAISRPPFYCSPTETIEMIRMHNRTVEHEKRISVATAPKYWTEDKWIDAAITLYDTIGPQGWTNLKEERLKSIKLRDEKYKKPN